MAACNEQKIAEQEVPDLCEAAGEAEVVEVQLNEAVYREKTIKRCCWGALYNRKLLQDLQFDAALSIGEDTLFFLEAFQRAGRIALVQSGLYLYVQTENSAYRSSYSPKQYTEFLAWKKIAEKTDSLSGPLRTSVEYELIRASARIYYKMLDSSHRDPQKEKALVEEVRRYKKLVYAMPVSAGWEIWDKAKMLSMLYVPPGVNRAVWGRLEALRAKKNEHKELTMRRRNKS